MLKIGMIGKEQTIVNLGKTASAIGSGDLEVLSTPVLAAMMEAAAVNSIAGQLEPNQTSVGIAINVKHLSPTPIGMTAVAESELIEIDGKRLVFKITASDATGVIGTATHERVIVDREAFLKKATDKRR